MRMQFVLAKINESLTFSFLVLALLVSIPRVGTAQTGIFGTVTSLGETPSDVVLDELRGLLYLVRSNANRVEVYDYVNKKLLNPITVGTFPVSAAMSRDGATLYVTNATSTSVSIIRLGDNQVLNTLSLPVRPEGIAVGADGRVLITTQGTGLNNASQTLLLYDPRQDASLQLSVVPSPAIISTANINQNVFLGLPITRFPGKLMTTPDGNFIVGMVAINQNVNTAQTTMFVYEVASGTILRNRTVTGQSTVLAMSPDGARFMAGSSQYDFGTLNVRGIMNTANLPFTLAGAVGFPSAVNFGGSVFSPDGKTLYSAFNYTATLVTQRPTSNILFIGNPANLGVRLGIRMPESVLGKMVITADGSQIFALSESGFVTLPIGNLFDYPILDPESTQVFLATDPCNKGIARASLKISNLGKGKLTYSVPALTPALVAQVSSGLAPSAITFTMDPGRVNVTRRPGTNVYGGNNGNAVAVNLSSLEAINIPNTIRVFMNYRLNDQRGLIFPIPTLANFINPARGLRDILLDEKRNRVYISNSALNRIEIFDTVKQQFLDPLEVGQFPQNMEFSLDRDTLYVANTGGESIQTIDLASLTVTGNIEFPPTPRNAIQNPLTVDAMAMTLAGLQFTTTTGNVWRTLGNQAVVRPGGGVFNANGTVGGNRFMAATPGGEYAMLLASATGGLPGANGYLFDATIDAYTSTRTVFQQSYVSYVAPVGAGPRGEYFLAGGLILGSSLTPIGGVERPGAVQFVAGQNGQVTQVSVSAGNRNVYSVWPLDSNRFLRATTPVRTVATAVTRDEERTTLELVDIKTQSESVAGILPENPVFFVIGSTQQVNIPARQMAVDSKGNVYMLTVSGLTLIPTTPTSSATAPTIPAGVRGVVNANDGTTNIRVGSFITINGTGLATANAADSVPLPTVLGGSCVTFNDIALPIISSSPTQIVAQVPAEVRPGLNVVQVRSLLNAQQSTPVTITVLR